MSITVNLRHLEAHNVRLKGELPADALDVDTRDEMVQVTKPLEYDFEVQQVEDGLLLQGCLSVVLDCKCVRCLKPFEQELKLQPWTRHVPLQGEEAVPVSNDLVDLTPLVREDILLEFPQHPLCDSDCGGLPKTWGDKPKEVHRPGKPGSEAGSSAWSELNKLKF